MKKCWLFLIALPQLLLANPQLPYQVETLIEDTGIAMASSLIVGDVDGDGIKDLIITNPFDQAHQPSGLHVFLGSGKHHVLTAVANPIHSQVIQLNDKHQSILTWSQSSGKFTWYEFNKNNNQFTAQPVNFLNVPDEPNKQFGGSNAKLPMLCAFPGDVTHQRFADVAQIESADIDQDGDQDVLFALHTEDAKVDLPIAVMLNRGEHRFSLSCIDQTQSLGGNISFTVSDDDKGLRVLPINGKTAQLKVLGLDEEPLSDQHFVKTELRYLPPVAPRHYPYLLSEDMDQDSRSDLIYYGANIQVLRNTRNAGFVGATLRQPAMDLAVLPDVNSDQLPDLLVSPASSQRGLYILQSDPTQDMYSAHPVLPQIAAGLITQLSKDEFLIHSEGRLFMLTVGHSE